MLRLLILLATCKLSLSLSATEHRRSFLLPWRSEGSASTESPTIGWVRETRNPSTETLKVSIGWGEETTNDAVSIELPYTTDQDSLASTLWPASFAGAILCRSPAFREYVRNKKVLELGSGLGLAGWTAAREAASCVLTDNDQRIVDLLEISSGKLSSGNVHAEYLEWRDEHIDVDKVDTIIATDVAYYYFLLRPLMDTARAYLQETDSLFLVTGQANRESQWELFHNLQNGCYNQLTDAREPPWPGSTEMLLYRMHVEDWRDTGDDDPPTTAIADSTLPHEVLTMGVLLHKTQGCKLASFTPYDHIATAKDEEAMPISF
jgi:predicted nicotinamide N-methyase